MTRNSFLRFALDGALIASVLYFPWWITLLIAALLLIISPGYEVLLAGAALDLLYGDTGLLGISVPLIGTAAAFVLFIVAFILKRNFLRT